MFGIGFAVLVPMSIRDRPAVDVFVIYMMFFVIFRSFHFHVAAML